MARPSRHAVAVAAASAPGATQGANSSVLSPGKRSARLVMSPLGSRTRVGMPARSASSSSTTPSPVLPEPVMPTMTPWVVRSAASSVSGCPLRSAVPGSIVSPRVSSASMGGTYRCPPTVCRCPTPSLRCGDVTFLQVTDEQIIAACEVQGVDGAAPSADDAGLVCRNVYTWTENDLLARVADWLATVPLRVALIFLVAWIVNRLVRKSISRFVRGMTDGDESEARKRLRKYTPKSLQATAAVQPLRAASRAQTIGLVLKSTASIVIYSIAVVTALAEVGINLAPLIAGAGIVGVALGFGAQSLVKDFLSGLFMLAEDQYGVGDVIDVGEATGTVEVVNLRTTKLRAVDGTVWHVPNGEIRRVGNMSQQWARALLDVEVAYSTDLGTRRAGREGGRRPALARGHLAHRHPGGARDLGHPDARSQRHRHPPGHQDPARPPVGRQPRARTGASRTASTPRASRSRSPSR